MEICTEVREAHPGIGATVGGRVMSQKPAWVSDGGMSAALRLRTQDHTWGLLASRVSMLGSWGV